MNSKNRHESTGKYCAKETKLPVKDRLKRNDWWCCFQSLELRMMKFSLPYTGESSLLAVRRSLVLLVQIFRGLNTTYSGCRTALCATLWTTYPLKALFHPAFLARVVLWLAFVCRHFHGL